MIDLKDYQLVDRKLKNFNLGGVPLDDYYFDINEPIPEGYEPLNKPPKMFGHYAVIYYRNEEIETIIEEVYRLKD